MNYETERDGQIEFFKQFGIPYDTDASVLTDNTDGVWHGNLLEFKLSIKDPNRVLFQAVKYLSHMRVKGESVPASILLIDLAAKHIYQYRSEDCHNDIQKVYVGAASKQNEGFVAPDAVAEYQYDDMLDASRVRKLLMPKSHIEDEYMAVDIDENCIVGWAERYYRELPNASKADFIGDSEGTKNNVTGEIREPKHFKGLIRPYKGKTNEKFKYLMDCLNDRLSKKSLGAFFTDPVYARKSAELVMMAVNNVPEGNDYIILDRCAGSGNLEAGLIGLTDKNGDSLISHCVVSAYEYYEFKVLAERVGSLVKELIPPTESMIEYESGRIKNADAMSEEYINNSVIKQYIDDPKCTIIVYENPPYHDESSGINAGKVERSGKRKSFVAKKMKQDVNGVATNELANQFIWSAFKYYLRQPDDAYIVYSPIKYWKQYDFCDKTPDSAFLFNRQHFHATASSISCILWYNRVSHVKSITAQVYDIADNNPLYVKDAVLKKCFQPASRNYSKLTFSEKDISQLWCSKDGTEAVNKKIRVKSYYNNEIIGYLEADSFQIAPHVRNITRFCLYNGNGCYLTKENYKYILPIWVAKHIPLDKWYEKDVYATTSDGGDKYKKDKDFLKSCLIYTCLSNQNKCLTFDGSDGRHYQNELCFDEGTVASKDLSKMSLDCEETELIKLWARILEEAKDTKNCNPEWTYGVYQITKELNTFRTEAHGRSKTKVYDYPQLNGDLNTLRSKLKEYYISHIKEKMLEYELVK